MLTLRYADVDCLAAPARRLRRRRARARARRRCARRSSSGSRRSRPATTAAAAAVRDVTSQPRAAARASADRLGRLLNLVPYLLARPGIAVAEAAADLGVTERQLREDLELLWVCGLPGYGPGDLIDMALRRRPGDDHLRRRHRPAAAAHPGRGARAGRGAADARRDARHRPTATRSSGRWPRSRTRPATSPTRRSRCGCRATPTGSTTLRGAVERGRALRITYYTATRDETTERVVDPMRVLMVGGRAYLEAWCRRAEAVRLFRVDRIDALTELDEPAAPPPQAAAARRQRRRVPARRRTCRWSRCGSAGAAGGSPSTTRARRSAATATSGWSRCGSPTWAGPAGSCSASGRTSTVVAPAGAGRAGPRRGRAPRSTRTRRRRAD